MAQVNFYRGLKEKYVQETHADGIYFATDTFEILMNGSSFGGGGIEDVQFSEGKLLFTFRDGTNMEVPITEATQSLPGLLSAADKTKLDNLPTNESLTADLEEINEKIGTNDYTDTNYISKETNLTDAAKQLDEEIKATNDNLAILNAATIKGVQVNGTDLTPSAGKVNIPNATTVADGAMSKEDKTKLDKVIDSGDGQQYLANDGTYKTLTKTTVGLGNVDNTSDMSKPVSTAQQAAIDEAKQVATDHIANKENPHEVTKEQVGLGNVTNDAQVKRSEMGVANGVATLDENGKIPSTQLNGQLASVQGVDQVVTSSTLPETGELALEYMVWCTDDKKFREWNGSEWEVIDPKDDTIYNFRNSDATGSTSRTNILYRWDGQDLTEISESVAIGETTGTAYDGAKGKANRDALNSAPTTIVTGFGNATPSADNVVISFTDSDKNPGNNQYSNGDGGNVTIPSATQSAAGLMSASDKVKVNGALQTAAAGVGVLANYTIALEKAAVAPTDTINQAIGKLEKALNDLAGDGEGSVAEQIQAAITALIGGASEGYQTLKQLEDAIKNNDSELTALEARVATNEGKLTVIQGEETVDGSIKKALKDAKDYTDSKLTWITLD